jgi:hypothetical protein
MSRGGQSDVDEIDVVAGDQFRITTECHGDGMFGGEILRASQIARGDGNHFRAEHRVGRRHDAAGRDAGRAQNSDAYHGRQSRMTARP